MIKPVCPHCDIALERRSNGGTFYYTCPTCFGMSLSFPIIRALLDSDENKRFWVAAVEAPTGHLKCSHCRELMRTVLHERETHVEMNVCMSCSIVWVDARNWSYMGRTTADEIPEAPEDISHIGRVHHSVGPWKTLVAILGIPVEERDDRFAASPWMTWFLIAICISVYIASTGFPEEWIYQLGYMSGREFPRNLLTMTTSFFLHGGTFHVLSNAYFLWIFGDNVEDELGKIKYVLLLLSATWLGCFLWAHFDPNSHDMPLVGASGGISGLVAYYLIRFPKRRFVMAILFFPFAVSGLVFGGLYFAKEIVGAIMESFDKGGSVAHLAHLGGALAGVLFAMLFAPRKDLPKTESQ